MWFTTFCKLMHPSLLEFGRWAKGKPGIVQKLRRSEKAMFDPSGTFSSAR
nr:hypothetical protein [Streptomyces flavovirens]